MFFVYVLGRYVHTRIYKIMSKELTNVVHPYVVNNNMVVVVVGSVKYAAIPLHASCNTLVHFIQFYAQFVFFLLE